MAFGDEGIREGEVEKDAGSNRQAVKDNILRYEP